MNAAIDHVFICCSVGGTEADALARAGLKEGSANTRWSKRGAAACPYGIVFRPGGDTPDARAPFRSWSYRPGYMPPGLSIEVARDTPLSGPELFYLGFQRGRPRRGVEPIDHELPIRSLSGVSVWRPAVGGSEAARALEGAGLVAFHDAGEYLLELQFDSGDRSLDFRPVLPLKLRW